MDAHEIRMEIKRLLNEARENHPDWMVPGEFDADDVVIEAMIHRDKFEIQVRLKT